MIKVYVAGPYSNGDVAVNVNKAFETGNKLAEIGFAPFIPHYTHFWHIMFPKPYEFWLKLDEEFLTCCDCLYRISGKSNGADLEEEIARKNNMPVFYNIDEITSYYNYNKGVK